mmetsp:Transcript_8037/g.17471  ORF Transcript_8037/g.17471 Transcript_8037/m.17471 type:complete len:159 (+) Transcript_8037:16-492(+)
MAWTRKQKLNNNEWRRIFIGRRRRPSHCILSFLCFFDVHETRDVLSNTRDDGCEANADGNTKIQAVARVRFSESIRSTGILRLFYHLRPPPASHGVPRLASPLFSGVDRTNRIVAERPEMAKKTTGRRRKKCNVGSISRRRRTGWEKNFRRRGFVLRE